MPAWLAWPVIRGVCGGFLGRIWSAAKAFFAKLNAQGWIGLVVSVLLALLLVQAKVDARHWHKLSDRNAKLYNDELDHEARVARQALDLKTKVDALTANLSRTVKEWKDEQDHRIAGAADDLKLHGPGKAVCPGNIVAAGAGGGSQQPGGTGNAALAQVPDGGRNSVIALPFADTVDFGRAHDSWRAEALAWRKLYAGLLAIWPKTEDPRSGDKPPHK